MIHTCSSASSETSLASLFALHTFHIDTIFVRHRLHDQALVCRHTTDKHNLKHQAHCLLFFFTSAGKYILSSTFPQFGLKNIQASEFAIRFILPFLQRPTQWRQSTHLGMVLSLPLPMDLPHFKAALIVGDRYLGDKSSMNRHNCRHGSDCQ